MKNLKQLRTAVLLVLATLPFLGTTCTPQAPVTTTVTIGTTLDLGSAPNLLARTFVVYLGGTTSSHHLNLTLGSMPAGTSVTLASPVTGGTASEVFTANGTVTTNERTGNVVLLTVASTGFVTPPRISIDSAVITSVPRIPAVDPALTNTVTALPVVPGTIAAPNVPIELPFDGTKRSYFISATGLAGRPLDIVLDGPGKVLVRDTDHGFALMDDESSLFDLVDATSGNIKSLTPAAANNTLLFTVVLQDPAGGSGLARFSVNQPTDLIDLTVRFADNRTRLPLQGTSPFPAASTMAAAITPFIARASQVLYGATEGRVRIQSLTVLTALEAVPFRRADVQIYPRNFPTPFRQHENIIENIALDLDWLRNGPTVGGDAGWALAHEIMHWRYGLLDEYRDPMPLGLDPAGPRLCPNSIMCVFGALELCWAGNHNPTGDPMLSLPPRNNASDWALLVPRLRPAAPTASPTHILRPTSNVVFTPATSTVN